MANCSHPGRAAPNLNQRSTGTRSAGRPSEGVGMDSALMNDSQGLLLAPSTAEREQPLVVPEPRAQRAHLDGIGFSGGRFLLLASIVFIAAALGATLAAHQRPRVVRRVLLLDSAHVDEARLATGAARVAVFGPVPAGDQRVLHAMA